MTQTCQEIHDELGVWPISFSYPRGFANLSTPMWQDRALKSNIIPGARYSYSSEEDYLANYQSSRFALTHKKGGWDCFRHLEVFASGALPVFPDAASIPHETMVHYPKSVLEKVEAQLPGLPPTLSESSRAEIRRFSEENLSSSAMAQYLLDACGISSTEKVTFLDEALLKKPDYLSVMTLIGLRIVLRHNLSTVFDIPYIYDDFDGSSGRFWGRGFGYCGVLPSSFRPAESGNFHGAMNLADAGAESGWLIVGSITRNWPLAQQMLERFDPARTIWIHGEDKPPTRQERAELSQQVGHVFVRELDGRL